MVIEVSYQEVDDAKDVHSRFKQTKYFEADDVPSREAVAQRLKAAGVDFDENTLSVQPYDEDAEAMRKGNISVTKF
jgi:hypothetical protein